MDIKDKLTQEEKHQMANLFLECQVLGNLLKERNASLENKAKEILAFNGLSPQTYNLKFNPGQNLWEAELKHLALIVPNRDSVRAIDKN
jgi:hypothetical protein